MNRADPAPAVPVAVRAKKRRMSSRFDLRDRVAAGNQLLLSAIVAVVFVVGVVTDALARPGLFALGLLGIVLGAIAALAVPWTRVSAGWIAVVPLADVLAIGVLRMSDPTGGLGLLSAFPAGVTISRVPLEEAIARVAAGPVQASALQEA